MSTDALGRDLTWTPPSCTLPTEDRPLRVAEFDELFAGSLRGLERHEPTRLRMTLESTPGVAARAADLVVRETRCCSFFTFALVVTGGELALDVSVPGAQTGVLDALAVRASTAVGLPT